MRRAARSVLPVLVLAAWATGVRAHEGPPYPLFVDRPVGPYTVSVWGDPDVGTGTFYVVFPGDDRVAPARRIRMRAWRAGVPEGGPVHAARRDRSGAYRIEVPFDSAGAWNARLVVAGEPGVGETRFDVRVTPPGYGSWDLLLYAAPFLLLGGLWAVVALRRARAGTLAGPPTSGA